MISVLRVSIYTDRTLLFIALKRVSLLNRSELFCYVQHYGVPILPNGPSMDALQSFLADLLPQNCVHTYTDQN